MTYRILLGIALLGSMYLFGQENKPYPVLAEYLSTLVLEVPYVEQYALLQELYNELLNKEEPCELLKEQATRCYKLLQLFQKRYPVHMSLEATRASEKACLLKQLVRGALDQERRYHAQTGKREVAVVLWKTFELLVQESGERVEPQNLVLDLLLNVVVISGEQFAQQLFSQQDKEEQARLAARIKKVGQAYKDTQVEMRQKTTVVLKGLSQHFVKEATKIQQTVGYAQHLFAKEVAYIQRLINLSTPPQRFVANQIQAEQFFKASPMIVPGSAYTWYNVYQIQDWEFDRDKAYFIQRGPIPMKQHSKGVSDPQLWRANASMAEVYQIFTEYFSNKAAYQIQVEVTLINCAYPFFAGIMFNKARWLSGSINRTNAYRLVGLYGTGTPNQPRIGLYLGQSITQGQGGLFVTTPLNQIVSGALAPLYVLGDSDVKGLGKDPLLFRFTLVTQESAVYVTLEKQDNGQWKTLFTTSVTNLDPSESQFLFWYHGIGFMAPGCQACFKIVQPEELLPSVGGKK